jgi:hypothetical protein
LKYTSVPKYNKYHKNGISEYLPDKGDGSLKELRGIVCELQFYSVYITTYGTWLAIYSSRPPIHWIIGGYIFLSENLLPIPVIDREFIYLENVLPTDNIKYVI